jgi:5-methyltetrahydropteroyltriglutamate--homocysteine methyltransferase
VSHQRRIGIDVVSDGEMGKTGFANYLVGRFNGFAPGTAKPLWKDLLAFPGVAARRAALSPSLVAVPVHDCVGPIELRDPEAIQRDIDMLRGANPGAAFMCAPSPGQVTFNFPNKHYPSHEAYLEAAGEALRHEYQAILDAGFMLQLDAPELAMAAHCAIEGSDIDDFPAHLAQSVEALNHAVRGLPSERMRLHVCWGNYPGTHHLDVELREIVDQVLGARPASIYIEAANPRHEHEWEVWQGRRLPEDKSLIVGVIDVLTNHIEHPRLVAQRILRFTNLIGRDRVIAGTDCGFATMAGATNIDPDAAWAKLEALVEGAAIASAEA